MYVYYQICLIIYLLVVIPEMALCGTAGPPGHTGREYI